MRIPSLWMIAVACVAMIGVLFKCASAQAQSFDIDAFIDNANVLVGDESGDYCSGTIIEHDAKVYILTAQHCVNSRIRREEKEFVDEKTGEVTKKTIEKKLDMVISKNVTKDYEKISRQSYVAKIWRTDSEHDIALLTVVDPEWKPGFTAKLAPDSYKLRRGETVFIIGNPGVELDNSITKGIVSATERILPLDGKKMRVFQTDAPAIGGNSGGSVLNDRGEIVGVLSAGMRGTTITFAVPVSVVKKLLAGPVSQPVSKPVGGLSGDKELDFIKPEHLDMREGWGGHIWKLLLGAF